MLLVLRAFLFLGWVSLLHASKKSLKLPKVDSALRGRAVKLVLDPSVKSYIYSKSTSNTASMSLSPWTYINSVNESRVPRQISQAKCLTSGCLNLQGNGEDLNLKAEPIRYQVLVLHRVPSQRPPKKGKKKTWKKYQFTLGIEEVTVGCSCVRPSVVSQQ